MTPTGNAGGERRGTDRRLTDTEIEQVLEVAREVLPKENQYLDSAPKRFFGFGAAIAAMVGVTTLIQSLYLSPINKELLELETKVSELDTAVRTHHENSAKEYVSKNDYDRDMSRVLSDLAEMKAMLVHYGVVKTSGR